MNKDIEIIQKVKIRGHILKILELSYPTATFESAVAAGLIARGLVSSPDIRRIHAVSGGQGTAAGTEQRAAFRHP